MPSPTKINPTKNQTIEIDGDQTDWELGTGRNWLFNSKTETVALTVENSRDIDLTFGSKLTMKNSTGHIGVLVDGWASNINGYGGELVFSRSSLIQTSGIGIQLTDRSQEMDLYIRGQVKADVAALVIDNTADVVVGAQGLLTAKNGTVRIEESDADLTNRGTIEATDVGGNAIVVTNGDLTFTNLGTVKGNIVAGLGNDWFDLTRGTITGTVTGGSGENTYVIDDQATIDLIKTTDGARENIEAHVSITLAGKAGFIDIFLAGAAAIDATGNDGANQIDGNDLANKLDGGAGDDTLKGWDGNDSILGGTGNDEVSGGAGDDTIDGGDGDDTLLGNSGSDTLTGGAGNDELTGGFGVKYDKEVSLALDTLTGGSGADRFIFGVAESKVLTSVVGTTVTDFVIGDGDRLFFTNIGQTGNANNYYEAGAAVGDLATLLIDADTKLNGTVKYYVGFVGADAYVVTDDGGPGITEIVKLGNVGAAGIDFSAFISG